MKTAVITGIRGQDGSYLAELLLEKGYKVVGVERRSSSADYSNIEHLMNNQNFELVQGNVADLSSIEFIVKKYEPDEFYNLAAQSFVSDSWNQAVVTCDINFTGTCNCLEALRMFAPKAKFLQASSSEVYGNTIEDIKDENTPTCPISPYGASKLGSEALVKVYREAHGMFACFSRAFNHESPRRGKHFVTRKITSAIGDMLKDGCEVYYAGMLQDNGVLLHTALRDGIIQPIKLGNIDVERDWTHAKDIVRGMWLMLQQDRPDDYVLASGTSRPIRTFIDKAFGVLGVHDWEPFIEIDPKLFRSADIYKVCGNANKARYTLGWEPEIPFDYLVQEMVLADSSLMVLTDRSYVQTAS